jgi:hypothetical protein
LNTASASNKQLLGSYTTIAKKIITAYDATVAGNLVLGAVKLASATVQTCASGSPSGSVCLYVSATYSFTYSATDFPTKPGPIVVQQIQDQINAGNLDCELKKSYPRSILKVTTGGGCKTTTPTAPVRTPTAPVRTPTAPVRTPTAPVRTPTAPVRTPTAPVRAPTTVTSPPVFSTLATVTNSFRTVNAGSISTTTLNTASSTANKQLLAAYDSLVKKRLNTFSSEGPLTYVGVKAVSAADDSSMCSVYASGSKCHYVSASFQFSYKASDFTTAPGSAVVNYVQDGINAGLLGCELKKLYPSSLMTVTTGAGVVCN